ncbi:MAG TPA: pimeloyl-ACP methyl ester esterase BioH [Dokdonella sp.]|uniref:pimeloyl-ACP methyl ester esterase BioH n=1 Tax=Dokdonella sp. TaxID=2291710 RepID=UPI002D80529A|nr:pimeloyl-ACP methyl ester esterase BioH [Dokdonella sp.]HET9032698.1 pimeloyl-ACP methyl ester esterase BioH [Dokdonella sp.]
MNVSITCRGQGPDLVLVHGWAMHSGIFAPLSERLARHFRLHLVDLPGHGHNHDYVPGSLDPGAVAEAIARATPPAIWIGWSLGGLVALRGALDHARQVRGLVEIAASPRFVRDVNWPHAVPATIFREFGAGLVAAFRPAIERFLALETLGSANAQEELRELKARVFERGDPSEQALLDGLDILDRADYRAELATFSTPSLWIAGRRDRLVPAAAMQWAAEQTGRGKYLEISAGHAPFLSHANEVAEAISEFANVAVAA